MIAETRNVGKRLAFIGLSPNDFSTGPKSRLRSVPFLGFNRSTARLPLENHSITLQYDATQYFFYFHLVQFDFFIRRSQSLIGLGYAKPAKSFCAKSNK